MATYAIGDIQGCLDPLLELLNRIEYDPAQDELWFTGDLINRGPKSLETLRFIHDLPKSTICVLGNHDLTLIAAHYQIISPNPKDTYATILTAPDRDELIQWLLHRPLIHHDSIKGFTLAHAGIYPFWSLEQAIEFAKEVEDALQKDTVNLLEHMYGNEPSQWHDSLTGFDRIRFIINSLTRMRFCSPQGHLDFNHKGSVKHPPAGCEPWFSIPERKMSKHKLIFGHWAALQGQCHASNVYALDSGCVYGNALSAFCLETEKRFEVSCPTVNKTNN